VLRSTDTPRRPVATPPVIEQRAQPTEPRERAALDRASPDLGRTAPQATPPARPAAPLPARPAAGNVNVQQQPGGGWVRDLLRGASREEPEAGVAAPPPKPAAPQRPPVQVGDSLSSLSVDIARAIDHEASIELWNRYRRGERDVFTRRLYTLKGQQTFDDIRRKYQNDPEFRQAVDRYCEDFEKLLKDIARSDRDNIMTQTYLTSDTGKVYTMLAHASGRLR
jgi:hypothetical protein